MALPLAQEVVFGLVIGSYIALGAIGFTLVYGLVNMINFAHGEFVTIGAYVGFLAIEVGGLPVPAALVVAFLGTAVVCWAIARVSFEPLNDAGAVPLLLTSIGLGLVLRNLIRLVAGAGGRNVQVPVATYRFEELGFFVTSRHLFVVGIALLCLVVLHVFLNRTMLGIAMRATSDDQDLALVSGIDARRVRNAVWLISSGLAGVAGIMLMLTQEASASVGFDQILLIITAAILGGIGSPYGAVAGSYVLGIGIAVSVAFLPSGTTAFSTTMAFVVLVLVLLVRPGGLVNAEVGAS
ncbi:MAG: branched-chain amino acid ABC transporter permease [Haloarculaceae archaeon]|jgi:neutral amino acid transport system permease protein